MKEFIDLMMEKIITAESIEAIITLIGYFGAILVLFRLAKSVWTGKEFLGNKLCASGLALALPLATLNLINKGNILFIIVFTGILIPLLVSVQRLVKSQKNGKIAGESSRYLTLN